METNQTANVREGMPEQGDRMDEVMEIVESVRDAWKRHIAGFSHVSRMTASTFVYYKVQGQEMIIMDAVAEVLYSEYCDDKQAGRHEADLAVQLFSEDI